MPCARAEVTDAFSAASASATTVTVRRPHLRPTESRSASRRPHRAGDRLTEGPLHPQDILKLQGTRVWAYLVAEIQQV